MKKVAKEWEIWDKKNKVAKSEKRGQELDFSKISQVNPYLWEESK